MKYSEIHPEKDRLEVAHKSVHARMERYNEHEVMYHDDWRVPDGPLYSAPYGSDLTYIIPDDFDIGKSGLPMNPAEPMQSKTIDEYLKGMNVNFYAPKTKAIFGEYRELENGEKAFEVLPPTQAKDVIVIAEWNKRKDPERTGMGFRKLGQEKEIDGIEYYNRTTQDGGVKGQDYLIFPVGHVDKAPDHDVSGYLAKIEKEHNLEIENEGKEYIEKNFAKSVKSMAQDEPDYLSKYLAGHQKEAEMLITSDACPIEKESSVFDALVAAGKATADRANAEAAKENKNLTDTHGQARGVV